MVNLCVLRSGGDYKPEHVQRLAGMVPDLVCLSDVPVDGVPCIPLRHNWPGWWSKIEICRPDIADDVFYVDLDTTVYNMPRMPGKDACLADFGDPAVIGSGLLYLTEKTRAAMWAEFIRDPQYHMLRHQKWPAGDQGFMLPFLRNAIRWQNISRVYSYKIHCKKGVPHDAEIVCFHGKPRPWEIHEKTTGAAASAL